MKLPRIKLPRLTGLQFKVLVIVAAGMAVSLVVSIAALSRVYGAARELERISREDFDTQLGIAHAGNAFRGQIEAWKNLLLRGRDPQMLDTAWASFTTQESLARDFAAEAAKNARNDDVRDRLDGFLKAEETLGRNYRTALEGYKQSFDAFAADRAIAAMGGMNPQSALEEAESLAQEAGGRAMIDAVERAQSAFRVAIAATVFAMLAALIGVWLFVRRSVLRPIGQAVQFAERIAGGDLTGQVHARSNDEAGQLLHALVRMNAGLGRVVSQVRAAAESVASASSQVAAGTTDLSQRTEEQASSLEETAASMEELASTVKQNADNAKAANDLASNASKRAQQGGDEVGRVVVTMDGISRSAGRIADIISVIDGIAFQTNILALNAAVEAARAGEQGRGFAVVAAEVRSLAQRSAQAAKEIKELIGASVSQVADGTRLVEQTGATISELVGDVKRVSDLMGSIADASAEQSRGVQQVNKTVTEMDKVVQQNASAVQQSAAAAEGMRRQAESLLQAVSTFRVPHAAGEEVAAPVAPAPILVHPVARSLGTAHEPARAAAAPKPAYAKLAPAAGPGDDWEEF